MSVQVDEAGERDETLRVHDHGVTGCIRWVEDQTVAEQQVARRTAEHRGTLDQVCRHSTPTSGVDSLSVAPLSNRYKTAIRTATPLVTCSTMTERAESATVAEISMPRFIGPGCMTIAWSGSRFIRRVSRP